MKPQGIDRNINQLNKIASRIAHEMDLLEDVNDTPVESSEDTVEEIKRLIVNLLNGTEMSTPELRRDFQLSNSQIWKVMSGLESSKKIKRARKQGRNILWTTI